MHVHVFNFLKTLSLTKTRGGIEKMRKISTTDGIDSHRSQSLAADDWENERFCFISDRNYSKACISFSVKITEDDGELLLNIGALYKRIYYIFP